MQIAYLLRFGVTTKLDLIESSDKGRRINPRRFDDLVEHIAGQPADAHVIVDTGSSAFVPLLHYVGGGKDSSLCWIRHKPDHVGLWIMSDRWAPLLS